MVKKIAVYGTYEAKVPVKQRYWKRRKDGIKQRYWKKTKRMKKVTMKGRYEFHGRGKPSPQCLEPFSVYSLQIQTMILEELRRKKLVDNPSRFILREQDFPRFILREQDFPKSDQVFYLRG